MLAMSAAKQCILILLRGDNDVHDVDCRDRPTNSSTESYFMFNNYFLFFSYHVYPLVCWPAFCHAVINEY